MNTFKTAPEPTSTIGFLALDARTFAQSGTLETVPEPTSTIGFLALGAIGAVSTLKRQLQSSK